MKLLDWIRRAVGLTSRPTCPSCGNRKLDPAPRWGVRIADDQGDATAEERVCVACFAMLVFALARNGLGREAR